MNKNNFTVFKEMSFIELSKKIHRPEKTLRTILARPEFNQFRSGKKFIITPAFCYHLYNFFELRKARCTNIKSIERTQKLLLKLRKEL